jgi:hypothetical protein
MKAKGLKHEGETTNVPFHFLSISSHSSSNPGKKLVFVFSDKVLHVKKEAETKKLLPINFKPQGI